MKRRGLNALIRLHRHELDEKRREIADAEIIREEVEERQNALGDEFANEVELSKVLENMQGFFGAYAQKLILRRDELDHELAVAKDTLVGIRDEAREVFQEAKKYELTDAHLQKMEDAEKARRDQIELDELALNMHRFFKQDESKPNEN